MSNSSNPIENNGHCNTLGTRAGTRVVLKEITATLQNSSPVQPELREVANNTQTGKTEHEVKVQFTREFVDAGAPDSRPASLSPAGSFRSRLAGTLNNKDSPVPSPLPVTPLRAVDISYVNSDISGLEDLITACGNIQLGDKIDAEESDAYNTPVDSALTITATENLLQSPNTLQNSSHEELFTSAINDSTQPNGTQDLSSDYQEAHETSKESINNFAEEETIESTLNLEEDSLNKSISTDQDSNQTVIMREDSCHSVSSDQFVKTDSELFVDSASFDFLLSKSDCKNTVIRDLRAESLYVQFDPLVSNANMLPQGPPQEVDGEENTKASIPQPTLDTPRRNPAVAAIDRLLIFSPAAGTPHKFEAPPKIEEKIVKEVQSVINETMAEELELVRPTVLQLESELEKERKELEQQGLSYEKLEQELEKQRMSYKKLEEELEKQRMSYKKLEEELAQEMQKKNEMTLVMDEYEKSLSRQMTDRETERARFAQERARLQEELQTANHHLGNTEAAFNDVHSKYERMKCVVSAYQSNEYVLKESVQENVETIKTLEARYQQLKSHAMSQLEKANLELEATRKQHETETARLQAMISRAELKSNSLAKMVEQKSKESKELAAILDEVIARVGENPA